MELPLIVKRTGTKHCFPVFVALGTEDTIVNRSFVLEYCREKYRGRLRVSSKEILSLLRKVDSKKEKYRTKSGSNNYVKRLKEDREALSSIEEANLL